MSRSSAIVLLAFAAQGVQVTVDDGDNGGLMRRESNALKVVDISAAGAGHVERNPVSYWATDACHTVTQSIRGDSCTHHNDVLMLETNVAAVVCCDENGTGINVGHTDEEIMHGCIGGTEVNHHPEMTYAAAVAHCATTNHRLCTFAEIYGGTACNKGCLLDCELVWTSTPTPCRLTDRSYGEGARCKGNITHQSSADCCSSLGIANGWQWWHP
mmetsp:Transcript_10606/g.17369  ORF Transcript_10606/g.17369 Transcript_10606/m.17369 type:complete len:214 (+) Transcript_10606:66-707(+)